MMLDERAAIDAIDGQRRALHREWIERAGAATDRRAAASQQPQAAAVVAIPGVARSMPDALTDADTVS